MVVEGEMFNTDWPEKDSFQRWHLNRDLRSSQSCGDLEKVFQAEGTSKVVLKQEHAWTMKESSQEPEGNSSILRSILRGTVVYWGPAWGTPPMAKSWGRRLDIRKGGIEPQESPWKSSSIYPHNQSLPTLLLCVLPYTSDFTGGCPPPPLSEKALT